MYGSQTLAWHIARVFVKWWVRRLIRKHVAFRDRTEHERSNMNIAKMQYNLARLAYWLKAFDYWGDWCKNGYRQFSYETSQEIVRLDELEAMGFNQRLRWRRGEGIGGPVDWEEAA